MDIFTLASYQVQGTCICLEVKWKDYTCFSDQGKLTHCKNKIVTLTQILCYVRCVVQTLCDVFYYRLKVEACVPTRVSNL